MRAVPLLIAVLALAAPVRAQPGAVAPLAQARVEAQRAHLVRVGAWGGASVASGVLVFALARRGDATRRGFGVQTAAWGAVNSVIAAYGLSRGGAADTAFAAALNAERGFHDVLLFNEGLNVAYVATGVMLVVAGSRGVRGADAWRGHGWAVVIQGVGLLVLDGVALLASRERLGALLRVAGHVSTLATPDGFGLALRF